MKAKERVIDLRQYFLYLWEKLIILIIVGGACAAALAVREYGKQKNSPVQRTSLTAIMNQNREAYYNTTRNYTDANRPANTVESRVKLYLDFNVDENNEEMKTDSNYFKQLAYDACALCVSESAMQSVIDKLDLHSYDDMKNISPFELSWLVNKNIQGAHIMIIVVTDVDADRAHDIAEAITEKFIENAKALGLVKNISIVDAPSTPEDLVIGGAMINYKKIIKHFIIGGAAGVIMAAAIMLIIFIIKDAVRTSEDIEFAGLKRFGRISMKQKNFEEDMKRFAVSLSTPDTGKIITVAPIDKAVDSKRIVEGIESAFDKLGIKVKVLSGDLDSKALSIGALSKESLKVDHLIIVPKDMIGSADAVISAKSSDATILLAKFGKTRMTNLVNAREELAKMNVNVPGVVVIR